MDERVLFIVVFIVVVVMSFISANIHGFKDPSAGTTTGPAGEEPTDGPTWVSGDPTISDSNTERVFKEPTDIPQWPLEFYENVNPSDIALTFKPAPPSSITCDCEGPKSLTVDAAWIRAHSLEEIALVLSLFSFVLQSRDVGMGATGICCAALEKVEDESDE